MREEFADVSNLSCTSDPGAFNLRSAAVGHILLLEEKPGTGTVQNRLPV